MLKPRPILSWLPVLASCVLLVGCAAQRHMERGEAALIANDSVNARHHFARALEHNPKLARDPEFAENYRVARRDAAVVDGERALRQRRPLDAIARFNQALSHHPDWSAAVSGLDRAHADAADDYYQSALAAADDADLDRARGQLRLALEHVAEHADANRAWASLSLTADRQPAVYRQAQADRAQLAWDGALRGYRQAVADDPRFLPARAAIEPTLNDAAADMLHRAETALRGNRFDDAEAQTLRTIDYRPEHPELPTALARIDLARGEHALAQDLPGAARVWFIQARDHVQSDDHGKTEYHQAGHRRDHATRLIRDRHRLNLRLTAHSPDRPGLADGLAERVQDALTRRRQAAIGFASDGEPVAITLDRLDFPHATVTAHPLRHPYTVHYDVPNPKIDHLERELVAIDRCLDALSHKLKRLERRHRSLHAQHPHGSECGCAHEVHRVQRELESTRREYRDARDNHQRLRHRLGSTPAFITKTRTEHWPYTRLDYRRTVSLHASYTLAENGGPTRPLGVEITDRDSTIEDARPDLGLDEDPLEMRSDHDLEDELLDKMAALLARKLSHDLAQRRVQRLLAEADRLAEADSVAAREARIAAKILQP